MTRRQTRKNAAMIGTRNTSRAVMKYIMMSHVELHRWKYEQASVVVEKSWYSMARSSRTTEKVKITLPSITHSWDRASCIQNITGPADTCCSLMRFNIVRGKRTSYVAIRCVVDETILLFVLYSLDRMLLFQYNIARSRESRKTCRSSVASTRIM